MGKSAALFFLLMLPFYASSQDVNEAKKDTSWKKGTEFMMNFSQVSLNNWAGGGQSSITISGLSEFFVDYKKEKISWENHLIMGYGIVKQDLDEFIKSEDKIDFSSQLDKQWSKKFSYAGFFGFKSQFTPGYNYPNDSVIISDFLAPGYVLLSAGVKYHPKKWINVYVAPLTGKITMVYNDILSEAGVFGVDPGKNIRSEFGGMFRLQLKKEIAKNVRLTTKFEAFSNYTQEPDHIDVNWDVMLAMKVNKFLAASITTNLIYDHDVDIAVDENNDGIVEKFGPRVQFKEVLAIGLTFKF